MFGFEKVTSADVAYRYLNKPVCVDVCGKLYYGIVDADCNHNGHGHTNIRIHTNQGYTIHLTKEIMGLYNCGASNVLAIRRVNSPRELQHCLTFDYDGLSKPFSQSCITRCSLLHNAHLSGMAAQQDLLQGQDAGAVS